jgi:biotin carboxyl carrier protein
MTRRISRETAQTPALPAATKVRKRAPAQQVVAPVVQSPVAVEEEPVADQATEQERLEDAAPVAGPHRNDDGAIIDPLTGEVLEGFEAGAFASVGDSTTDEALLAAQRTVSDAKAMLSPSRYQALAWLYFHARKAVRGAEAPSQYQQLRAI